MKKIISAVCICVIVSMSACGSNENDNNNAYPPNPDSTLHNDDTPSHGPDGYAPPNVQDSVMKDDSTKQQ